MLTTGTRKFRPGWGASIAAAVAMSIAVSLGNWQTRRAEEKLALQERLENRARGAALQVPPRLVEAKDVEFARVSVRGEFLRQHTILLDNRVHNGVVGYDVVTPIRIEGGELCVLVNRGWIAAGPRRDVLPKFPTPAGPQPLEGIAMIAGGRYFELGGEGAAGRKAGAAVEPVWQHLKLERFAETTGLAVQPFFIQQTSASDDGLERVWERPDRGVNINRGYAFQWYSLAALILVIYVVLNLRNVDTAPPRQD
jgi:surfeit locus 1 family protein